MNPKDIDRSNMHPDDGRGGYFYTSQAKGTTLYLSPGFWDLLRGFGKWLVGAGGWVLYVITNWSQRGP